MVHPIDGEAIGLAVNVFPVTLADPHRFYLLSFNERSNHVTLLVERERGPE